VVVALGSLTSEEVSPGTSEHFPRRVYVEHDIVTSSIVGKSLQRSMRNLSSPGARGLEIMIGNYVWAATNRKDRSYFER
jgi:hypothetical protein